jgi:hypothetical protein
MSENNITNGDVTNSLLIVETVGEGVTNSLLTQCATDEAIATNMVHGAVNTINEINQHYGDVGSIGESGDVTNSLLAVCSDADDLDELHPTETKALEEEVLNVYWVKAYYERIVDKRISRAQEEILVDVKTIRDKAEQIRRIEERNTRKARDIEQFKELKSLASNVDLKEQTKMISALPEIKEAFYEKGDHETLYLIVRTEHLNIFVDETEYIGTEYEIRINLINFVIRINGAEEKGLGYWGSSDCHPHISGEDGTACLGSAYGDIYVSLNQGEFFAATLLLLGFLKTANTRDVAGKYVQYYPQILPDGSIYQEEAKYCRDCGHILFVQNRKKVIMTVVETIDDCGESEYDCDRDDYYYVCEDCIENYSYNHNLDVCYDNLETEEQYETE